MTIISRDEFKNNFDYFFNNKYSKEIFINDNGNIKVLSSLKTYNSLRELASQKKIDIKNQENNDFIDVISFNQKCINLNSFFYNISIKDIDTKPLIECCSILLNKEKKHIENYIEKNYLKDIAIALSFFDKEEQKLFLLNFTENECNEILKYIDTVQDENNTDYMNLINRVYKTSNEYSEDFINKIIEELNKIPNACIEKILGNIKKIDIDLTLDLYNGVTLPNDILYYTKIEAQHIISNINIEKIPYLIYFMSDNAKEYVLASISKGNRKYIEKKISTNSLINEKVDEEYKESIKQYRREIYKSIKFINTITDVKKQKGIAFLEKINSDKIKEINDLIAEEIKKRKEVLSYYILQGYKDELIFLKNYLGENNTYTNISFVKQTFESLLNKDEFLFSKNDYKYFSEYKKYLKKIDIEKLKFFFEQIENIDIDLYEFFSHLLIEVKDITYLCDLDCSKLYSYYCDTNYLLFKFYDKNETVKNKMLRNFSWVKNDYEIVSEKDIKEFEENLIKEMLKQYLDGDIQFLDNNEI